MTNYTALSVRPPASRVTAERFEGIYLDARSFLLVLMLRGGAVKTKTIRASFSVTPETVARLTRCLNEHLVGCEADQISLPVILEIERRMGELGPMVHPIVRAVYDMMTEDDAGDLQIEGVNRLLQYPEYADREELRSVIDLLEKKGPILDMVNASRDSDGVNVYIGSENPLDESNGSSLVFKTISAGERVLGAIGVIGPRRMDYSKVITTVEYLSESIAQMIGQSPPTLPQGRTEQKE
jgi:heat-inducible transcriptional repressor